MVDHPGIKLREITNGKTVWLRQNALAEDLGVSRYSVNQLMNGHRNITPEMALRLESVLKGQTGLKAKDWLLMQLEYDLEKARRKFDM